MLVSILRGRRCSSGRLLLAGFGGLLALMCLTGIDAVVVLRQAKISNAGVRQNFLARSHSLEQLRSGIYVSGTLARDYLLAADPPEAGKQRDKLRATQRETETAL